MNFLYKHKKLVPWTLMFLSLCLLVFSIALNSCSTSNYNTPITTQTSSTLISPETLKTWIDSGVVNSTGNDRVVILDVTSASSTTSALDIYNEGHIPGAQFVDGANLYQYRQEGPAVDQNMNLDGPHMDAIIQKNGIDKNTMIVFTTGGAPSQPLTATRAYWTFRYWGFPKEKLKFLDGVNFSWAATYGLTTDTSPSPTPSTYSVKNNALLRTDLRASLNDMINVAEGRVANAVPIDMRTAATAAGSYIGTRGSTPGVFFAPSGTNASYVVFEGHLKGGKAVDYKAMFDSANNYRFKSPDDLAALFTAQGIDSTKLAHVY